MFRAYKYVALALYMMGIPGSMPKNDVDVYIMSLCLDARMAMTELVVPAIARSNYAGNVRFEFIANVDANRQIVCKHSEDECTGNKWILTVQEANDVETTTKFAYYLLYNYNRIPDPAYFYEAAKYAGIRNPDWTWEKVRDEGYQLLRNSALKAAARGAKYSATIQVNGKTWCIVDGGERRDCQGDVDDLAKLMKA